MYPRGIQYNADKTQGPVFNIPAVFADATSLDTYVPSMLVVGSVTNAGVKSGISSYAPYVALYGPGEDIAIPKWSVGRVQVAQYISGTSPGM